MIMDAKKQLTEAQQEVEKLRTKLNELDKAKEAEFQKKEQVSKEIVEKIKKVKDSKVERNKLSSAVQKLKKERDVKNKEIKEKIDLIKTLKKGLENIKAPIKATGRKFGKKESNESPEKQIQKLEYKLETTPMSFDAEKKIMRQIRELKKKVNVESGSREQLKEVRVLSKEIDAMKKDADKVHDQIQEKAEASQKHHELLINESKAIKDLKKKEEELYKEFLKKKEDYLKVNQELKEKLDALRKIKQESGAVEKKESKAKMEKIAKDLEEKVEKKIKEKKKLTTEDLLIMQRQSKDE